MRYCNQFPRPAEATHSFTFGRQNTASGAIAHDLSGFEDGTENPSGENAWRTALIQSPTAHLNGGSLWTLQRWQHDFKWLSRATVKTKEQIIGRSLKDNQELPNNTAHIYVHRTRKLPSRSACQLPTCSMPCVMMTSTAD